MWFFLYESRALSLENVDFMYAQDDLKPWTSHKWVPPGYATRLQRNEKHFRSLSLSYGKDSTLKAVGKRRERV